MGSDSGRRARSFRVSIHGLMGDSRSRPTQHIRPAMLGRSRSGQQSTSRAGSVVTSSRGAAAATGHNRTAALAAATCPPPPSGVPIQHFGTLPGALPRSQAGLPLAPRQARPNNPQPRVEAVARTFGDSPASQVTPTRQHRTVVSSLLQHRPVGAPESITYVSYIPHSAMQPPHINNKEYTMTPCAGCSRVLNTAKKKYT
jgi:hypothetical protein